MANDLETTLSAINAGEDFAILASKRDIYQYVDGKRVGDEKIGTGLDVVLQGNKLSLLKVNFEGKDPIPDVTDEMIAEACKQKSFIYVKIHDCVVSIYVSKGKMGMSATASGAELLNIKSK